TGQRERAISAFEAYLRKENRPGEARRVEKAKEQLAALRTAPGASVVNPPAPFSSGELSAVAPGTVVAYRTSDGDRLLQERKYREAALAYQDAVAADAGNVEALFKLGTCYAVLGYYP